MRYFMDTEFIEDGRTIDLISIGIVAEDGREFYMQSNAFDESKASDWVRENVFPHLAPWPFDDRDMIVIRLFDFIGEDKAPEFWAYYADYDWVAFCQLFGTMMDLPKGWPMHCRDLRQWLDDKGYAGVSQSDDAPHYALDDARWVAETWKRFA